MIIYLFMPTINQLLKKSRKTKKSKKIDRILQDCPQKKAIILKLRTAKPKKPNSAI
jgi:small subunit ribosomal protein S12